jgi:hypothetical protein
MRICETDHIVRAFGYRRTLQDYSQISDNLDSLTKQGHNTRSFNLLLSRNAPRVNKSKEIDLRDAFNGLDSDVRCQLEQMQMVENIICELEDFGCNLYGLLFRRRQQLCAIKDC